MRTAPRHLEALARKELLARERPPAPFTEAARFHHVLIRDAAYRSIPKARRVELHERLGDWLREAPPPLRGEDELVGYHLEQAYLYRKELGQLDERAKKLGEQAAERLAAAGRRASLRGDELAAENLFRRALALLPKRAPERGALLLNLADALIGAREFARVNSVLEQALLAAHTSGHPSLEWRGVLLRCYVDLFRGSASTEEVSRTVTGAIEALEQLGDEAGLALAWVVFATLADMECRFTTMQRAAEQAGEHARRVGDSRLEAISIGWIGMALMLGSTPTQDSTGQFEALIKRAVEIGDRAHEAYLCGNLAHVHALAGRLADARVLHDRARAMVEELGAPGRTSGLEWMSALTDLVAGDLDAAEATLRSVCDAFRRAGRTGALSLAAAGLAEVVYRQGRYREAEELSRVSEETAPSDDIAPQITWRGVRAKVLARRMELDHAERLAREATALAGKTDALTMHGDALMALAEVLRLRSRDAEATAVFKQALDLYEKKGDVLSARRVRAAAR